MAKSKSEKTEAVKAAPKAKAKGKQLTPLQRAKAYAKEAAKVPGKVQNGSPDFAYYWLVPEPGERGMPPVRVKEIRQDLTARGYEKCTGDEFISGVNAAEIWRLPKEVADWNKQQRIERNAARMKQITTGKL